MDLYATVVGFFQDGGPFMYPIAIVLGIGIAIAAERFFFLANQTRINRRDYDRILPLLKQRRVREIGEVTKSSRSPMARIAADGLNRLARSRRRSDIEYAMEEGLLEVLPTIERRTPYLATFANIATLLGLLGTIVGPSVELECERCEGPSAHIELSGGGHQCGACGNLRGAS